MILLHTCSSFILTVRDLINFMRLDPGALPFATEYTRITPSVNPINNCNVVQVTLNKANIVFGVHTILLQYLRTSFLKLYWKPKHTGDARGVTDGVDHGAPVKVVDTDPPVLSPREKQARGRGGLEACDGACVALTQLDRLLHRQ